MSEEREMVLRMLKEGKISVEEADALLQALADETAAEHAEQPRTEEMPPTTTAPHSEWSDVAAELRGIFQELRESLPGEVLRGIRQARPWSASFRHVVRGLSGLEEGHAEVAASERVEPGNILEVRNAWGDVRLSRAAGPELQLRARIRVWAPTRDEAQRLAESLQVGPRRDGPRVIVGAPMVMEARRRIDLELEVPAGVDVVLDIAKGDIRTEGLRGSLRVEVARGDVQIAEQDGTLELAVASGDISLRRVGADVRLDVKSGDIAITDAAGGVSGRVLNGDVKVQGAAAVSLDVLNGDISLADVSGDIEIEGKNGDVAVRNAQGRVTRVRTLSGDLQILARTLPDGGMLTAETTSGDVDAAIPPDSRATVDAATVSGDLRSSLPLQAEPSDRGTFRRRSLRGTLNGGGAAVTLRTTRGDIRIRSTTGE